MFKFFMLSLTILLTQYSIAATVEGEGEVDKISTYSSLSGVHEDIVIKLSNTTASCDQYWIKSDVGLGYKNIISMALSAFHSQAKVYLTASNSTSHQWGGSSLKTCQIISFSLYK